MPTNWLKPMSAGTVVSGPLGGGEFQDWLATQANTGLPQKPEDAQKLWERYMDETGKAPAGFGGGKVPLPDTSKEGIMASSLAKMRDVLQKYNDPRWKKFIDAAGINVDKVRAFVEANSPSAAPVSTPPPPAYQSPSPYVAPQNPTPVADPPLTTGQVTTPGTMPSPNAPSASKVSPRPLGNNPLDMGSILPQGGTARSGYQPNRRRYF